MQRKKVPAGHHRFGLARLVLVLALLFLVVALTAGLPVPARTGHPGHTAVSAGGVNIFVEIEISPLTSGQ